MARLPILLAFSVLLTTAVSAQSTDATVTGRVLDETKAAITGAKVDVINVETNARSSGETNAEGVYLVPNLTPGTYRIEVSSPGFKMILKPDVTLHVQDVVAFNFTLAIGSLAESVTVQGGEVPVNTQSAAVSTVIDRQFVENMPLNGRSFQTLIQLTPGVVLAPASFASPGQFSVNGQRTETNYFTVDGVSANIASTPGAGLIDYGAGAFPGLTASGGTNSLVSVDALQEFRIQTSTFAPEYGRTPGAQVSLVTRSGGNQFHGTLFDFFRNDALDAKDWFTNKLGLPKPALRQNNFGGTFSGPMMKDRMFFFFSYEALRLRQPQTASTDVPSMATRQAAVPAMQPFLNSFPIPNGADLGNGLAEFTGTYSNPSTLNASSLRLDHNLANTLRLFARYNYAPSSNDTRATEGTALNDLFIYSTKIQTSTVGADYLITPRIASEFRYNYSKATARNRGILDDFGGAVPFDESLVFPSGFTSANSALVFGSVVGRIPIHLLGNITTSAQRQHNLIGNITVVEGAHEMKFGLDWRRLSPAVNRANYLQQALFSLFSRDIADTIAGTADIFTVVSAQPNMNFIYNNFSLFGQDRWRINPRATLTYGLRWDFNPTPNAGNGTPEPFTLAGLTDVQHFDPADALTLAPQGTPLYHASRANIAPRVGIAYRLLESERWGGTLRGGYGVFYDLGNTPIGSVTGFPYSAESFNVLVPFPADPATAAPPPLGVATSPISSFTVIDPNLKTPYTLQWNAAYEQQLGNSQSISLSYVGAAGRNLLRTQFFDFLNSNFDSIQLFLNGGTSNYNAMQLQYQRQLSRGLQALASYTWSHAIDTESQTQGTQPPSRGSADFDIRHAISAAVTYELPKPNWNRVARAILGDWALNAFIIARSAPPVELGASSFVSIPFSFLPRPDVVPGESFTINDPAAPGGRRFNPAAFTDPPDADGDGSPDRQGNLSRNALRAFGATQVDFAVQRTFRSFEGSNLSLRADFFNIFNHPNFGPPVSRLDRADFGVARQTLAQSLGTGDSDGGFNPQFQIGGPRSVQLSLKLEF